VIFFGYYYFFGFFESIIYIPYYNEIVLFFEESDLFCIQVLSLQTMIVQPRCFRLMEGFIRWSMHLK
jgi:hypothetical protein